MTLKLVSKPIDFFDLGEFNIRPVEKFLSKITDAYWKKENEDKENQSAIFHHTQHIVMKFVTNQSDPRTWYENPLWNILKINLEPELQRIVAPLNLQQPQFPKIMLARLREGSSIDRHVDNTVGHGLTHKIHVPIETSTEVLFEVDGVFTHLARGRAYEVNNLKPHSATNPTNKARVHLIFEAFDGIE